jgi:IS30 family transposase
MRLLKKLPRNARKSLTLDNGGEFAKHTLWRKHLRMETYFCDPYASWQKGAVENSNRWLRRELPRNTDLHALTQEEFDESILNYNLKPRKCRNWMTPLEAFNENINRQTVGTFKLECALAIRVSKYLFLASTFNRY